MTGPLDDLADAAPAPPHLVPRTPRQHDSCSKAGYHFQLQHFSVFDFFWFSISLSTNADKVRFTASKVLAESGDDKSVANFENVQKNPEPAFQKLRSFARYHSEVMIVRLVDNFMCFLSETLQACMWKRPELLKSREQVRIEDVLRFTNRRDLLDFLINRKLNELSYGGLRGIEEFLDERLGVPLSIDASERAQVSIAIELRNIYTHNRGIVNELFLSRLAPYDHDFQFAQGKRFQVDFDTIVRLANNLFDVAIRIDDQVLSKFRPLKKRFATWDAPRVAMLSKDAETRKRAHETQ